MKRATKLIFTRPSNSVISIHALMKRATTNPTNKYYTYRISIHALMKRATRKKAVKRDSTGDFNPRPHEEGD